ncbi:1,4-Dihydroxy-2-naphthoyl-CoA synthase [Desulfacinum infernum DSM 9756]|jgi:dihydroxynaphthoic acid synthetase|uniref:1,4-Dihydroxy-2-naphthoyl-CoA synthase n=1 Tax=Desulfacinum infernum DSM 9756 TaxID=1121391 RepID=A0A1M4T867_9BACT|nr:enoyl-CoA hydratase-related protein [Desulfacinum infernum]MBC7360529.1 enoyl-CoA hydratase/isomerase family protein [Desulfacinum sp.]SHE40564.1 1,4-Dihydroxy-2-naphthoyl-CoA synthase [Desulfacinum infernum DSM 9756]
MSDVVLMEYRDGVAWITLNREKLFNAINTAMMKTLVSRLKEAEAEKDVGVVVITGAGRAFCAGGDLEEINALGTAPIDDRRGYLNLFREMIVTIRSLSKPVIAAVNGYCIGGGNELNVACDLSIASEKAKFGQAGPRVGSVPLMGATQIMPLLVGEKRAKEIIFLCRTYSAREAAELGWVNKVVAHDDLVPETQRWCDELLVMSPTALAMAKRSLNAFYQLAYQSMEEGMEGLALFWGTDESREGILAFKEKRKPQFRKYL